eukprot:1065396-Pelagomonas_calceolata.AAC.6
MPSGKKGVVLVQRLNGFDGCRSKALCQVPVAFLCCLHHCNVAQLPLVQHILDLLRQLTSCLLAGAARALCQPLQGSLQGARWKQLGHGPCDGTKLTNKLVVVTFPRASSEKIPLVLSSCWDLCAKVAASRCAASCCSSARHVVAQAVTAVVRTNGPPPRSNHLAPRTLLSWRPRTR